ncbi:titin isoform X1 [Sesbania bispinosa]|nr:titin isoform X1 [Sesbania bispinosa]
MARLPPPRETRPSAPAMLPCTTARFSLLRCQERCRPHPRRHLRLVAPTPSSCRSRGFSRTHGGATLSMADPLLLPQSPNRKCVF